MYVYDLCLDTVNGALLLSCGSHEMKWRRARRSASADACGCTSRRIGGWPPASSSTRTRSCDVRIAGSSFVEVVGMTTGEGDSAVVVSGLLNEKLHEGTVER